MSSEDIVVEVAQEKLADSDIVTLRTGYRVRFLPVSPSLITDVISRIGYPAVPTVWDEKRNREIENPNDPSYIRACEDVDRARGTAALDALVLFGVELLDPLPEDGRWMDRLALVGIEVDADNPIRKELAFKKYEVFKHTEDILRLRGAVELQEEDVARAAGRFRRPPK